MYTVKKGGQNATSQSNNVYLFAANYEWDVLIWIRYDRNYAMQEAWQWDVEPYKKEFHDKKRISLGDIRHGRRLFFCLGKVGRGTSVEKDIDDLWD